MNSTTLGQFIALAGAAVVIAILTLATAGAYDRAPARPTAVASSWTMPPLPVAVPNTGGPK